MKFHIGNVLGFSRNVEVVIISLLGLSITIFDSSLFTLKFNLDQVWNISLDSRIHSAIAQIYIKKILAGVILVKTFTLHITLALYVVMLYPALFEDRHNLLLPWIIVACLRYLVINVLTLITGCFLCLSYEGLNLICSDFILSQIIDHGPAVYAWLTVLSFYQELKQADFEARLKQIEIESQQTVRRKMAKSIIYRPTANIYEHTLNDARNFISQSTIDNLTHHFQNRLSKSRSLDTLLNLQNIQEEREQLMFNYEECNVVSEAKLEKLFADFKFIGKKSASNHSFTKKDLGTDYFYNLKKARTSPLIHV